MKNQIKVSSLFAGAGMTFLLCCILAALSAFLCSGGILPVSAMRGAALTASFLGCLAGGWWTSGRAHTMALPTALCASAVYLLAVFVLRGILFGGVGDRPYILVLFGVLGALAGAVLGAGKSGKNGRRRRK